ncbi:hypothetical protein P3G66_27760 [Rhodococcus sp. C3V]|nr:hypothetical protein [Rhodococcus sp. C3V]
MSRDIITGIRLQDDGSSRKRVTDLRWANLDTRETGIESVAVLIDWIRSGMLVRIHNREYGDPQVYLIDGISEKELSAGLDVEGVDLLMALSEV